MTTMSAQLGANPTITGADQSPVVESARKLRAALERYAPGAADWLCPSFLRVLREALPNDPTVEFKPRTRAKMCSVALDTPKYLFKINPGFVKRMTDAANEDQERRHLLRQLQAEMRSHMPFRAFDFVTNGAAVVRHRGHDDQMLPQELADAIGDITLRHGFRERTLQRVSGPFYLGAGGADWKYRPIRVIDGKVIAGESLPGIEFSGNAGDGPFTASLGVAVWPVVVDLDRGEAHHPLHASQRLLPLSVPINPPPKFPDVDRWSMDEWEAFWVGLAGGLDAALADAPGGTESCSQNGFSRWTSSQTTDSTTCSTTAQCAAVDLTPAILRAARELSQQTQAQLGERIGVSKMSISTWETGRKPIPKNRQAELGQVLGRWLEVACKPSRRSGGR